MKKLLYIFLLIISCFSMNGCYQDLYIDSLDEYIFAIENSPNGISSLSLDHPDYFLPSFTFLKDFEYIEGEYYLDEKDPLRELTAKEAIPDTCLLYLKYEETVYIDAKQYMMDNIKPYNDKFYEYNNYIFYENSNKITFDKGERYFPSKFSMACYNDFNNSLIFLSFYNSYPKLEDKYINDINSNWGDFIEKYYGEYYYFSK